MAKVNDILNKYGVKRESGRAQVDTILGKYGVKPSSVSTPKQPESKSAVNPLMETMTSGRGSTGSVYNDVRVALFGPSALLPSRPRTTEERIKDAETSVTNWEKQVEEIKERTRTPVVGSTSYGRGSDPALSKPAPTVGSTSYGAGSATQVTKNEELERAEEALRQSRKALDGLQQTKYWADARMTGIEGLQDKLEHLADDEGALKQERDRVRKEINDLTADFEAKGGAWKQSEAAVKEYSLTRAALQGREAELTARLDEKNKALSQSRKNLTLLQREKKGEEWEQYRQASDYEELLREAPGSKLYVREYPGMTKAELELYNYFLQRDVRDGTELSREYMSWLGETLAQRKGVEEAKEIREIENPILRSGATAFHGAAVGLDRFARGFERGALGWAMPEETTTSAIQYGSQYIREDLEDVGPEILGSSLGQIGYDVVSNTANMLPSVALGAIHPALGAASVGLSAGGNAYDEAIRDGYSPDQARAYAFLCGASEAGLQYFLGGISKLGNNVIGNTALGKQVTASIQNIRSASLRVAAELGTKMLSEANEEYLQEILGPVFRNLAFGEDNEFHLVTEEAAYAALLAIITTGMLEGPEVIGGEVQRSAQQRGAADIPAGMDETTYSRLAQAAMGMDEAVQAQKTAPTEGADIGLIPVSETMKRSLSTGKNNVIAQTAGDIVAFVKRALGKKGGPERLYMGTLPENVTQFIKSQTGIDVSGYQAILPGASVQHIFNNHGDALAETARGQRAVSPADIALLPQVIASPDSVRLLDDVDADGRRTLQFSKQIGDTYVTVQGITDGRHALTTDTFWIKKGKPTDTTHNADISASPVENAQSAPPSGSPLDPIIPSPGDGVNSEYAPGGGMDIPMDEGTVSRLTKAAKEMYGADQAQKTAAQTDGGGRYLLKEVPAAQHGITDEDIKAVQAIGRKSVNELTSEEITATKAFATKYWREMGEKSPFFRAWFGDWRANDQTPVQTVKVAPGLEYKSGKATNEDTGMVMSWSRQFRRESLIHGNDGKRISEVTANIEQIVKRAILLDTVASQPGSKSKMPETAFMHSFYAVVDDGSGPSLYKLFAEEALNNKGEMFRRAYDLKYMEKVATPDNSVLSLVGGLTGSEATTSNLSVSDLLRLVKEKDSTFAPKAASKVVDTDGKPLVVYHGTNEEFNTFQSEDGAYWFSASRDYAAGKGEQVVEAYLNLKDPYYVTLDAKQLADPLFEAAVLEGARAEGYDGAIITVKGGEASSADTFYVAFSPEQIKSATDNIGTFDRNDPDIHFSLKTGEDALTQMALEMGAEGRTQGQEGNVKAIQRAAHSFGEQGSQMLQELYWDDVQDPEKYFGGFAVYYHAGLTGQDIMSVREDYDDVIKPVQARAAYRAGQVDAAASLAAEIKAAGYAPVAGTDAGLVGDEYVASHLDSKSYRQLNSVLKLLGVRGRFVDGSEVLSGKANAQIKGSEVLIAKDHQHPIRFVLGHELTHRIQRLSPEAYRAFRDFVAQDPVVRNEIEYKRRTYGEKGVELDYEGALDEAVADYAGELLEDGRLMDEFIERHRENRSLLQWLKDSFHYLVGKLTGKEKAQAQTAEGKLAAALDAAAEQAKTLTKESGGQNTGLQMDEAAKALLKDVGGKKIVWLEKSPLTKKELNSHTAVAEYISQHIGEVYTIIESGQSVYLGEDLPAEYTQSKYTSYIRKSNHAALRAKNRATSALGELIETATNRRWEKTKHPQSKDAKYGMYRYNSTLAFPVKDNRGVIVGVRAYDVELLIRNASDGKEYLYDIVNIKENTTAAIDLTKMETRLAAYNAAPRGDVSKNSIP